MVKVRIYRIWVIYALCLLLAGLGDSDEWSRSVMIGLVQGY